MSFKNSLIHGIVAGAAAAGGAFMYASFYNNKLFDYSNDLKYTTIISAAFGVTVLASVLHNIGSRISPKWNDFIFNSLFSLITMASIMLPINAKIQNEIPDYFPIYAIPLHFFPLLMWFSFKPLFTKK